MYRFRELLHIYTTVFIGIVLALTYLFIPRQPLRVVLFQLLVMMAAGFVVGVVFKFVIDKTVPIVDPAVVEAEDGATLAEATDGEATIMDESDVATVVSDDTQVVLEESLIAMDQPGMDDYLDEDFLDELDDSYE